MPLFRALAHLLLALGFVAAAVAQAQAVGRAPTTAPRAQAHHASAINHECDHGGPARDHAGQERDGCRMACCVPLAQLPGRAPEAIRAEVSRAVRYVVAARSVSDRTDAPDPGIPKHGT